MSKHSKINEVAILGLIGNISLLIAKLVVGFASNSQAMIADGLNSSGDVFASVMTYIGNRISAQPEDSDHPYGHGKAEYIFSMIISFSLLFVAFTIFMSSLNSFLNKVTFVYNNWLVVIGISTIIIKYLLYIFSKDVGKRFKSLLALANAEDHRNDIFITLLTLFSIGCGYFNIYFIDSIGGMLISFWIAFSGFKIFTSSYNVLMDTNVDDILMDQFSDMIENIEGVDHIDAIHAKPIGLDFLLIVKISIDADITVYKGHEIASRVRNSLETLENVEEVIVHVNPAQYHPLRMERKKSKK